MRFTSAIFLSLGLMLASDIVAAAGEEGVIGEAREAFRLGSQLTKHGQWAEALAACDARTQALSARLEAE